MFAIFSTAVANGTSTVTCRRGINGARRRQTLTGVWPFSGDQYKPQENVREKHNGTHIGVWVNVWIVKISDRKP